MRKDQKDIVDERLLNSRLMVYFKEAEDLSKKNSNFLDFQKIEKNEIILMPINNTQKSLEGLKRLKMNSIEAK